MLIAQHQHRQSWITANRNSTIEQQGPMEYFSTAFSTLNHRCSLEVNQKESSFSIHDLEKKKFCV